MLHLSLFLEGRGVSELLPQRCEPGLPTPPHPPALGVWNLSHWTTREVLKCEL